MIKFCNKNKLRMMLDIPSDLQQKYPFYKMYSNGYSYIYKLRLPISSTHRSWTTRSRAWWWQRAWMLTNSQWMGRPTRWTRVDVSASDRWGADSIMVRVLREDCYFAFSLNFKTFIHLLHMNANICLGLCIYIKVCGKVHDNKIS